MGLTGRDLACIKVARKSPRDRIRSSRKLDCEHGVQASATAMSGDRHQLPTPGQIVRVRQRLYLVEEVVKAATSRDSALVRHSCVDDDNQGQPLEVLWDREIAPQILTAEAWEKLAERGFDAPKLFSAYLNTLQWNCVTATDPELFQSPFRAGMRKATVDRLAIINEAADTPETVRRNLDQLERADDALTQRQERRRECPARAQSGLRSLRSPTRSDFRTRQHIGPPQRPRPSPAALARALRRGHAPGEHGRHLSRAHHSKTAACSASQHGAGSAGRHAQRTQLRGPRFPSWLAASQNR
jgi:hypothetical protein